MKGIEGIKHNLKKKKKEIRSGPAWLMGLLKLLLIIYKLDSLGRGNDMNYEI